MIPSRLLTSRLPQSSPSVALEKGAYRMRSPTNLTRPRAQSAPTRPPHMRRDRDTDRKNAYLAILIVLLAIACLGSFGAAYYLFSTRWAAPPPRSPSALAPADAAAQVIAYTTPSPLTREPGEKYLSYLPHSGFHNQRIAFENALVLARLLNRTLLAPPARLGAPLRYVKYTNLVRHLALSDKEGLRHCAIVPESIPIPSECTGYDSYTLVPWDWLVDLRGISQKQKIIYRWNMSEYYVPEALDLAPSDILTLHENDVYQYRFVDTLTNLSPSNSKFAENLYITDLARAPEALLELGTLFGSSRIRLRDPANLRLRRDIRASMPFASPELLRTVHAITRRLGRDFVGVHVRLSDGIFREKRATLARDIWRDLVYNVSSSLDDSTFAQLENIAWSPTHATRTGNPAFRRSPCRRWPHTKDLRKYNVPVFLATDIPDPENDPDLAGFFRTFPCTHLLGDYDKELAGLRRLKNGYDGLAMEPFLLPFLDAMVVGQAKVAVGTEGSTFSRFILDVLWRVNHGLEIEQRG
ncbi:hypothetical protein EV715DRAFT_255803 [Schizophyllum commune]